MIDSRTPGAVVRYRCHNFRLCVYRLVNIPDVANDLFRIVNYLRLVILSVGFQYSLKKGLTRGDYILQQVYHFNHFTGRRR